MTLFEGAACKIDEMVSSLWKNKLKEIIERRTEQVHNYQ